jgi:two-component system, OmpR family, phosphate regulon sensor histidine kinase PhoR
MAVSKHAAHLSGHSMSIASLNRLGEVISRERAALLAAWRKKVRQLPGASDLDVPALNDHIPDLLDELSAALQSCSDELIADAMLEGTSPEHGRQRLEDGFDIAEVVAEYNILRGCIYDLAESHGVVIRGGTLHTLNRVLDEAIGLAVQTYATQRALEVKQRRDEQLAFVAHDLRTPLSAVALSASLLEMILGPQAQDPQTAQVLSTMHRNIKQLEGLVAAVLNENVEDPGAGGDRIVRRRIDLWPLVEGVIRSFDLVADTGGTQLRNEVPNGLMVYADAGMLSRIFQNLISNAIKYTPRGIVTLGADAEAHDGKVVCWVKDNGPGIPPELAEKIFDKYEKDPERGDGIGLGLAIVKEFVEAHGGSIRVESEMGVGSTFRATLPAE